MERHRCEQFPEDGSEDVQGDVELDWDNGTATDYHGRPMQAAGWWLSTPAMSPDFGRARITFCPFCGERLPE